MTRGEAVNWLINIMVDIGKAEHSELWHYEQALSEIREMLESEPKQPERKTGRWIPCPQNASWLYVYKCSECGGYLQISDVDGKGITAKYCSYCGAKMEGEQE